MRSSRNRFVSTSIPKERVEYEVSSFIPNLKRIVAGVLLPAALLLGSCRGTSTTTISTNLGLIRFDTTGEFLYNAFEATSRPALGDHVSYNYTTGAPASTTRSTA
jgi:hypothetical protein